MGDRQFRPPPRTGRQLVRQATRDILASGRADVAEVARRLQVTRATAEWVLLRLEGYGLIGWRDGSRTVAEHRDLAALMDLIAANPPGPELRCLTIQQPWASAIASGGKTVENRTWTTAWRGLTGIHAGKGIDWQAPERAWLAAGVAPYRPGAPRKAWSASLPAGVVLAVARLAGCHADSACMTGQGDAAELCTPWSAPSQYHWQWSAVTRLADPVPCKGALGLWFPDPAADDEIQAQLGTAT